MEQTPGLLVLRLRTLSTVLRGLSYWASVQVDFQLTEQAQRILFCFVLNS